MASSFLLLLVAATPALAQGLYYKEIQKDGRIYVFNVAANADRFEKSGEMTGGITKEGRGPNGETIIADTPRALQLFYFRHGISEVVPEPAAASLVWRDGKTRITTENAYLELSNRVQARFTQDDDRGSFRIRRAKTKFEGWMIRPWLTYEVQLNWPSITGSNPGALLEDAAFDVDFTKGRGLFRLRAGQFKPPFGGQEMTSSGNLQFVDRALVSNSFFRGRETGVALWGATPDNRLEWRVGMFNGNGQTRPMNDNDQYQYNARLMWQPNGSQALNQRAWVTGALYSESDFESTGAPIYAVALNWENQNTFGATTGNDQKWTAYSVDGIFKYKGLSVNGMYSFARRTPEVGARFDAAGGFIQAGKLFSRRRVEIALRHGRFDPSDLTGRNTTKETRGAFSYYYSRHTLKWQSDIGQVETQSGPAPSVKAWEFRSQLQFVF